MAIRMMIVDDSPDQRDLLRAKFEEIGCEVVAEARDGAEAIELFEQLRPELVTLDIFMPNSKGIDALNALRAMREICSRVRVVIVSAFPLAKSAELFLSEGAFALVEKPIMRTTWRSLQRKIVGAFPELAVHLSNSSSAG